MGWARFDDNYTMNPKILAAGPWAELLDTRGIIWCARNETDGLISRDALKIIGRAIPKTVDKAAKLVQVGRWSVVPEGWMVLRYLDFNPSHEQCEKRRVEGRERAERSRERNAKQTRTCAFGSGDPRGGDGVVVSFLDGFAISDCGICDNNGLVLNDRGEAEKCPHGSAPLRSVESETG